MTTPANELFEIILKDCHAKNGEPWYPLDFSQSTGVDRNAMDPVLDQLRLAGLVELTEWVKGKGQGYVVTDVGERVLDRPRQLARLRSGQFSKGDFGSSVPQQTPENLERRPQSFGRTQQVREGLQSPTRPVMTYALIVINLFLFLAGMSLDMQQGGQINQYLAFGDGAIQTKMGALIPQLVIGEGQWWRILASGFLHFGLLHLGMNMYALYILGGLIERLFGKFYFLLIYFTSLLGGSCMVLYLSDDSMTRTAGASGAICGLLGSMLAWVVLNKSHLGKQMYSMLFGNAIQNIVLITFISLMPFVSGSGHLGGGLAGFLVTVPLVFARYESGSKKLLGLMAGLAVPLFICGSTYYHFMPKTEIDIARARYGRIVQNAFASGIDADGNFVDKVLAPLNNNERVDKGTVLKAYIEIDQSLKTIGEAIDTLESAPKSADQRITQGIKIGTELLKQTKEYLEANKKCVSEDRELAQQQLRLRNQIQQQLKQTRQTWEDSALAN